MKLTLTIALATWAVGVQLNEAIAAVGAYASTALVLFQVRPTRGDVQRWWPVALFVAWGLTVPLLGNLPTGSGVARLTDWLLLPVAAAAVTRVHLKPVAIAALIACGASCLAAALQHFGLWPAEDFFAPLAFTKIPFARVYEPLPGSDTRFMAGGLIFHRLRFASVTSLVVLAAAAHWPHGRAIAAALVGFVSVAVFPAARAAAAALALALATLVKPRWLAAGALALVAAAGLWSRTTGERLGLLQSGLNAIAAHPLTGVGLGRFLPGDWAAPGADELVVEHVGKSHHQLVTFAAEGGIPLALLFVVLLGWLVRELLGATPGPARSAGLAALAFFVLLSQVHDPLFQAVVSQAVVLLLGGALGLSLYGDRPPKQC